MFAPQLGAAHAEPAVIRISNSVWSATDSLYGGLHSQGARSAVIADRGALCVRTALATTARVVRVAGLRDLFVRRDFHFRKFDGFYGVDLFVHAGRLGYRYGGEILDVTADGSIMAARLDLPETAPYARVEVTDSHGRRAWTNPLWQ